eukprot:403338369
MVDSQNLSNIDIERTTATQNSLQNINLSQKFKKINWTANNSKLQHFGQLYNSSQVGVINYDNLRQSETTQDPSFILSHDFKSKETLIDLTKQSSDSRVRMEFLKNEDQSQQSRTKHEYELKKQLQHQQYLKSQEREAQQIRIKINKMRQKYNKQINKKTKEQLILMNRAYKPLPKLNQLLNSPRILNIDENAIDNDSFERDISSNDVNDHEQVQTTKNQKQQNIVKENYDRLRNAKTAYKANRQSRTIEQQVYQQPITSSAQNTAFKGHAKSSSTVSNLTRFKTPGSNLNGLQVKNRHKSQNQQLKEEKEREHSKLKERFELWSFFKSLIYGQQKFIQRQIDLKKRYVQYTQ